MYTVAKLNYSTQRNPEQSVGTFSVEEFPPSKALTGCKRYLTSKLIMSFGPNCFLPKTGMWDNYQNTKTLIALLVHNSQQLSRFGTSFQQFIKQMIGLKREGKRGCSSKFFNWVASECDFKFNYCIQSLLSESSYLNDVSWICCHHLFWPTDRWTVLTEEKKNTPALYVSFSNN